MKKPIIIAAALVAMAGCNKSLIESPAPADADYGYINFGVTADTEMVITKALSYEGTELDDYKITLYSVADQEETPCWDTKTLSEAKADADLWKVPAGNYRIYVENMAADDLYKAVADETNIIGNPHLAGETDVTVYAGLPTEDVTVQCTANNSKISFIYNDSFNTVFDASSISLNVVGTRTVNLVPTYVSSTSNVEEVKADFEYAYFPAAETLTWTMSVKTNAAGAVAKTYSSTATTTLGKWTIVTFSTGSTDGTIDVTITTDGDINSTETITFTLDPTNTNVSVN